MSAIIPHTDQISNVWCIFIIFAKLWESCECGYARQHCLHWYAEPLLHSFLWHFLLSLSYFLLQGFFLMHYLLQDGWINPAKRIKEREKKSKWRVFYTSTGKCGITFHPGLKEHLLEASSSLRGGKKHSLKYCLLWYLEFGGIHLCDHDKEFVPVITTPEKFEEEPSRSCCSLKFFYPCGSHLSSKSRQLSGTLLIKVNLS